MPPPPRTSIAAITAAGGQILEARGLQGLTMQAVALAAGLENLSTCGGDRGN